MKLISLLILPLLVNSLLAIDSDADGLPDHLENDQLHKLSLNMYGTNFLYLDASQAGSFSDYDNLSIVNLDTGETFYEDDFSTNNENWIYLHCIDKGNLESSYVNDSSLARIENGLLRLETIGFQSNGSGGYDSETGAVLKLNLPENYSVSFDIRRNQWAGHTHFTLLSSINNYALGLSLSEHIDMYDAYHFAWGGNSLSFVQTLSSDLSELVTYPLDGSLSSSSWHRLEFIKQNDSVTLNVNGNIHSQHSLPEYDYSLLRDYSPTSLTFTLNGDGTEYSVSDCLTTASGYLEIPSTYNGLPVTSIWNAAFHSCSSLTSITIPDSVTLIGLQAFYNCSGLTSITIPDSVTSIGNYAFSNCTNLINITIPNSVTSIGDWVFWNCSNLNSITIPEGVTSIGNNAFQSCTSLTSITLPNSVTSIGDGTFRYCNSLASVTFEGDAPTFGTNVFLGSDSVTVYYNSNKNGWSSTVAGSPAVPYNSGDDASNPWGLVGTYYGDRQGMNLGEKVSISPEGNLLLASTSKGFILLSADNNSINLINSDHSEHYGSFSSTGYPSVDINVSMGATGKFIVSNHLMGHNPNGYFNYGECKYWHFADNVLSLINSVQGTSPYNSRPLGTPADYSLGIATSFSADGTRMLLGTDYSVYGVPRHNPERRYPEIRVFELPSSDWVEVAKDIPNSNYLTQQWYSLGNVINPYGYVNNQSLGDKYTAKISGDGNYFVFSDSENNLGNVEVYELKYSDSYSWEKKGQSIYGEYENDYMYNTEISHDGEILVIGSGEYDHRIGNGSLPFVNAGIIKTYTFNYDSLEWQEATPPIIGNSQQGVGKKIRLSGNGKTLAVATNSALEIYTIGSGAWILNHSIEIDNYDITSLDFSIDFIGSTLLVGARNSSGSYGSIDVYKKANVQKDTDQDGIDDVNEIVVYKTLINNEDSNSDGLNDGAAVSLGINPNEDYSQIINYISNNTADFNIQTGDYSSEEYSSAVTASRTLGQTDVTGNPSQYGLFTSSDLNDAQTSSRTAGQQDVIGSPSDYDLMGAEGVFDMRVSLPGISTDGDKASMNFTIQSSNDLQEWNNEETIRRDYTMPSDKNFMRVSVGPQLEPEPLTTIATDTYGDKLVYDEFNNLYVNDANTPLMIDGENLNTDSYSGWNFYAIESTDSGYICIIKSNTLIYAFTFDSDGNYISASSVVDLSLYESLLGQSLN